jgi:hypothetical protein
MLLQLVREALCLAELVQEIVGSLVQSHQEQQLLPLPQVVGVAGDGLHPGFLEEVEEVVVPHQTRLHIPAVQVFRVKVIMGVLALQTV